MRVLAGLILMAGGGGDDAGIRARGPPEKGHEQAAEAAKEHGEKARRARRKRPGWRCGSGPTSWSWRAVWGTWRRRNAGPFFAARTQKIRQDMVDAQEARMQSEARAAEVDRRLANLESEIGALKAEALQEEKAEKSGSRNMPPRR